MALLASHLQVSHHPTPPHQHQCTGQPHVVPPTLWWPSDRTPACTASCLVASQADACVKPRCKGCSAEGECLCEGQHLCEGHCLCEAVGTVWNCIPRGPTPEQYVLQCCHCLDRQHALFHVWVRHVIGHCLGLRHVLHFTPISSFMLGACTPCPVTERLVAEKVFVT